MSCSINLTANILDISAIRKCLFPSDDTRGGESWLQCCVISVSPTGDIIAIAHERRLVILSAKWDSNTSLQYQITYSDSVHESDNIKDVACLPIVSQSKNHHVVPDWTCILLGFESGFLRFYTESCELLVEEQLHTEVISHIKCRSQHNPRPDLAPDLHPDEIYVQYQSTLCVIPGNQIFPMLRICRADLARVQAKGETLEPLQGNLTPRKWGFTDQATINDVAVVGVNLHGQFDHLLTASTCGGFETKYRTAAPYNNLVLAAGSRPFLGYHYALEGCAQPVFSDVAKAVATKLKSALPGWLTGAKTSNEKQMTTAMQPSETMGCRFGLCDLRRTASSLVLSPDHRLAAVCDALGRVLLVDAFRGIVLRVFKGYREAQCSFLQVPDEKHSKHRIGNKIAHFLVIYSPKKGTLEIFTVQQGQKITTFSAGKYSRLIYNNYGLMGFTSMSKSRFVCLFDTLLIDNDGKMKEISVPFHFAVSDETNSARARDIHLYKKLKSIVKASEGEEMSEIYTICAELKTEEYKYQTLEYLLGSKRIRGDLMLKCLDLFDKNVNESEVKLRIFVENTRLLLYFFEDFIISCDDNEKEYNCVKVQIETNQFENLKKLAELQISEDSRPVEHHVQFDENFTFSQFLACFTLDEEKKIGLKHKLDGILLFRTAEHIYDKLNLWFDNLKKMRKAMQYLKMSVGDLFFLLLHWWVYQSPIQPSQLENSMNSFYNMLTILVSLADKDEIQCEYGETSPFWNYIREILAKSSRPFNALTAAILCKILCETFTTEHFEDMEVLTQERIAWTLLIGKLEDISLLTIILSNNPIAKFATLPKLKQEKSDVSLVYILERGKGSVSELVARWLTLCGINPENIVVNEEYQKRQSHQEQVINSEEEEDDDDDSGEDTLIQPILPQKIAEIQAEEPLQLLNKLRTMFPHSLEAPILLANMCWEYSLAWSKNTTNLELLSASIKCLSHVSISHIREGMCKLIWNAHLKVIFESSSKLINKVGKLPKEKLCRQDTNLADYQLASLLGLTTDFLEVYMVAVRQSFRVDKPVFQYESIWEPNGPIPLVQLAIQQNEINYDLLHLHFQLSRVLHMLTHFTTVKHAKPMNTLFESYMLGMFFQDFQNKGSINWNYADSRVQESRMEFLSKVIAASVETVSVANGMHHSIEHCVWMERVIEIGRLWNLNLDELRRIEVVVVYVNGFDVFGDELFTCVENKKELGVEMLKVAARRLSLFFATSPNIAQNTCAFTPAVTIYMAQLDREWCAPSDLAGIENIANRSRSCLERSQYEYKIADYLLDGVRTLIQLYEK